MLRSARACAMIVVASVVLLAPIQVRDDGSCPSLESANASARMDAYIKTMTRWIEHELEIIAVPT